MMAEPNKAYLEDQFHQDMITIYETGKKQLRYNASYFIQMIGEYGGVKTAKKLLGLTRAVFGIYRFMGAPTTGFVCRSPCPAI